MTTSPDLPAEGSPRLPFHESVRIGYGPASWLTNGLFLVTSLLLRLALAGSPQSAVIVGLFLGAVYALAQAVFLVVGAVIVVIDARRGSFDPGVAVAALLPPALLYFILLVAAPPP